MKKLTIATTLLTFMIFGCKKSDNYNSITSHSNDSSVSTSRNRNVSMEEMTKNPLDKEDEAFNSQLLLLGKGLLEVTKNSDYLKRLIDASKTDPSNEVNLNCFLNTWQDCKCVFNNELEKSLDYRPIGDDHCAYVNTKMTYKGISYWPTVYMPNAASAEIDKGYFIAIGTEININLGLYENEIPAWWVKPNGEIKMVTIHEDNIYVGNVPIIIISNSTDPVEMINGGPVNGAGGIAPIEPPMGVAGGSGNSYNVNPFSYRVLRYRLSERFETNGKSEFCVFVGTIPTSSAIVPNNYTPIVENTKIADVDKDDIGTNIYNSYSLFGVPDANRFFYFMTFERDGWATHKTAAIDNSGSSNQISLQFRAKYANEIYHFGSRVQLDSNFPTIGSYQNFVRYGDIDIQRGH